MICEDVACVVYGMALALLIKYREVSNEKQS